MQLAVMSNPNSSSTDLKRIDFPVPVVSAENALAFFDLGQGVATAEARKVEPDGRCMIFPSLEISR